MIEKKIKSVPALRNILLRHKRAGKRIVFTNGCFDILHYGHVKYLEDARKKGDILVVGINSDASVRRLKGAARPLVAQADRLRVIAALESVDYVTVFSDDTPLALIKTLRPDVLVKGADWQRPAIVGADIVSSYGGRVLTIALAKNRSTTNIIKKIAGLCSCAR